MTAQVTVDGEATSDFCGWVLFGELREFRTRFGIPISDADVASAPFYRPPDDSYEHLRLRILEILKTGQMAPNKIASKIGAIDETSLSDAIRTMLEKNEIA